MSHRIDLFYDDLRQKLTINESGLQGLKAPFAIPGLCLVAGLGIAAQNRQVLDGASGADVVSDLVDFSGERLGAGQAEDVVDAVVLAPRHRLRPSIVPVAT